MTGDQSFFLLSNLGIVQGTTGSGCEHEFIDRTPWQVLQNNPTEECVGPEESHFFVYMCFEEFS